MSAVFVVLATNLSDVVETLRQPFPVREGRGEKIDAFGLTYSDEHYIQSDKGMGTVIFQMPGATSRASGNGWSARRCCAGEGCCIIRGYPCCLVQMPLTCSGVAAILSPQSSGRNWTFSRLPGG